MKKMTLEDFKALKFGDKVHQICNGKHRSYTYVGRMPQSPENYFILSDGEDLIHVYRTKLFGWYSGKYDSKFVGELLIQFHQRAIERITKIHFNG